SSTSWSTTTRAASAWSSTGRATPGSRRCCPAGRRWPPSLPPCTSAARSSVTPPSAWAFSASAPPPPACPACAASTAGWYWSTCPPIPSRSRRWSRASVSSRAIPAGRSGSSRASSATTPGWSCRPCPTTPAPPPAPTCGPMSCAASRCRCPCWPPIPSRSNATDPGRSVPPGSSALPAEPPAGLAVPAGEHPRRPDEPDHTEPQAPGQGDDGRTPDLGAHEQPADRLGHRRERLVLGELAQPGGHGVGGDQAAAEEGQQDERQRQIARALRVRRDQAHTDRDPGQREGEQREQSGGREPLHRFGVRPPADQQRDQRHRAAAEQA